MTGETMEGEESVWTDKVENVLPVSGKVMLEV
jgi:hypothetical protein